MCAIESKEVNGYESQSPAECDDLLLGKEKQRLLCHRIGQTMNRAKHEGLFTLKNSPKKIRKKSEKSQDFFEDLKFVHLIWK